MSPHPIPRTPANLRGRNVLRLRSQQLSEGFTSYLADILDYRRRTSNCIKFSRGGRCECNLVEVLGDETNLFRLSQIVSQISVLKHTDQYKYDEFVRKQRKRYTKGDYKHCGVDEYMIPESPDLITRVDSNEYWICFGFWANLMQINRSEWKKFEFITPSQAVTKVNPTYNQSHSDILATISSSASDLSLHHQEQELGSWGSSTCSDSPAALQYEGKGEGEDEVMDTTEERNSSTEFIQGDKDLEEMLSEIEKNI